jgi:DNA uptake protein ComE-like DNA-binding protein
MNFKQFFNDYFTFSRNERKGVVILIILIIFFAIANKLFFFLEKPVQIDRSLLDSTRFISSQNVYSPLKYSKSKTLFPFNPNTIDSLALDSLLISTKVKNNLLKYRNKGGKFFHRDDFKKIFGVTDSLYNHIAGYLVFDNSAKQPEPENNKLFPFDPNKATDEEFVRLGLSKKQIEGIRKYLEKGGAFKTKDDFLKIYVIPDKLKQILAKWLIIPSQTEVHKNVSEKTAVATIEINSADSIQLKQLPGIGNALSKRIVKYRDMLGGFYSVNQIKEVYGLNDRTFSQIEKLIKADPTKIRKIDINFSDSYELSKHPYLQKDLSKKIVKFRAKIGKISNPQILLDSMILNTEQFSKIKPYL